MDRRGTMSSLDVDEIVSSFDAKMMHPKDGPGFTHGVSFPVAIGTFGTNVGLSLGSYCGWASEIHRLVDVFSPW